jgi:hypothetical protein
VGNLATLITLQQLRGLLEPYADYADYMDDRKQLTSAVRLESADTAVPQQPRLQLFFDRFAASSQRWRSYFSGIALHTVFRVW